MPAHARLHGAERHMRESSRRPPATQDEWDKARFETRRALDAHFAKFGGIDAIEPEVERQDEVRRAAQAAKG